MAASPFLTWLDGVLADGASVQHEPPGPTADQAVVSRLQEAFVRHALDVAGPPLAFDPAAARLGAELLAAACWRQATGEDVPLPPGEPAGSAAHLSADVCLRLVPGVYRRAVAAGGPLAADLAVVLRGWPLAGVLADLDGRPAAWGFGHPGLDLLYAERLAAAPRAGWVPPAGPARDAVDRVFALRNLPVPEPAPHV